MPMRKHLFLAAACFVMAGCDLFDPYEKPATETPAQFTNQPAAGLTGEGWPDPQWWQNFHSEELTKLQQQAAKANFDIAAAAARVREADAQVAINGAPLLPSLEADIGGTHTHTKNGASGTGSTTTGGNRSTYNAGLQAAYELDFWGKNRSVLREAEAAREAQIYDKQIVALSIGSSIANTYFDLLATRARLNVAQENLQNAKKTLDTLNRQFHAGIISRLDVAQQQSVVDQQGAAIAPLQLQITQDHNALALLTGTLPEQFSLDDQTSIDAVTMPVVPVGLSSELLQRRPDVAEAEANLKAAHASINAARAAFFPNISLTGSFGYQSSTLGRLFNPGGQLYSFSADLVQPIFEGGLLSGQLDLAHAQYDELAQAYFKSVINAFADTENALAALQRSTEQLQAEEALVKSSKDAASLSQRQFEGGIVDITSVLNTQRTLFSAQDSYLLARLQQLQAASALYQALGGGWTGAGEAIR